MHVGHALRLVIATIAVASLGLLSPSPSGAAARSGTITYAEEPGANPNFIFPFVGCAYSSVNNVNQFQQLMYRPLYWFGLGSSANLVSSLSLAKPPVFANGDRALTITMKGWRFADGQVVDARSVMFFLNMYKANPTSYCGYNAGYGIPDEVQSASGNGNTVRITFTTPVNPNWILYNYLSEITPMPDLWDRSSATQTSSCATGAYGAPRTDTACKDVEAYLTKESTSTATFTHALWQHGVDGPWRLTNFDAAGNATFQANPVYSGPQRAQVHDVKEIAYTTLQSEESDLLSNKLSLGYVDPSVLTSPALAPGKVGPNWVALASHYSITTGPPWSFNFAVLNFASSDPNVAAIDQLYVRQALQYAVDQHSIIESVDDGYGTPIYSPLPPSTPLSIGAAGANSFPFNLAAARTLLSAHGWTLENGVQTCTNPGTGPTECGFNIALDYVLSFNVVSVTGSATLDQTLALEIANWQGLGIEIVHTTDDFNNVVNDCTGAKPFEICSWGYGWSYTPSDYPSGEALFLSGASFNVGAYSDAHMTALIRASVYGKANLRAYANYAAKQLPVLFQPEANPIDEVAKTLKSSVGFAPNPLGNFMPEYMHF